VGLCGGSTGQPAVRWRAMWGVSLALALALVMISPAARAQEGPEAGGHEIEIWTGGGHGTNGSTSSDSVFNMGVRYGWIITEPHLPGFLRGRFEYAVDAVPVFLIFQPANTAYAAGLNPIGLKWDFVTRGSIAPYMELGGGVLFSNHEAPTGTSTINFTPTGAIGMHVLGKKLAWSVEARFLHISNAGLANHNPGINTAELRIGVGWFRGGNEKKANSGTKP
jgi:lipid A 3-O-deacylase